MGGLVLNGLDVAGTTAQEPSNATTGQPYFNTSTGKYQVWDGTQWVHNVTLDSTGRAVASDDLTAGTAGTNVTAAEYSADGINFTSILTLSSVAATIGDNASLANGALIYTFPAGPIVVKSASMSAAITLTTGTPTTDTPELGLGTVVGSGANATLGDVGATSENILGPVVAANVSGTANVVTTAANLTIETAAAHTVYFNYADAWADVDDTAGTISGTVTLNWSKIPLA